MGMTEQAQEKGLPKHWLAQILYRVEIKIEHFHKGSKATGKAARAFRVLL